jgi:hypothetical protein
MSTLIVKVCEMCGDQFSQRESWLVVDNLDIKRGRTAETLLHVDDEMDFCSPGCLLRYVSRSVEHALGEHEAHMDAGRVEDSESAPAKQAA